MLGNGHFYSPRLQPIAQEAGDIPAGKAPEKFLHIYKKNTPQSIFCGVFRLVENTGIEPVTSCMPCKRSPS